MAGPQVGDRISEYILLEQRGAGSFGQVWKARHHIWKNETVAIKIPMDTRYIRSLQQEGVTIHGLRHVNIVRAIGLDPYGPVPYLVMEYVDGPSLAELVKNHPSGMPVQAVQTILCGILRALDYAHGHKVIHRDIKPSNVMIATSGGPLGSISVEAVKVMDFGLGKAGEITTTTMLQSGSLLSEEGKNISGTLAYMAPEQRDGGETDARSDLFSVGVVLFEMVCGERPSGGDAPSHVRDGLPSWVDLVFSRLYTRKDRRFVSALEALRTIELASAPPGVKPPPPPIPEATPGIGQCPKCAAAIDPWDNYCIMCGTATTANPRRCAKCGGFPAHDDRFCVFCGTPLVTAG